MDPFASHPLQPLAFRLNFCPTSWLMARFIFTWTNGMGPLHRRFFCGKVVLYSLPWLHFKEGYSTKLNATSESNYFQKLSQFISSYPSQPLHRHKAYCILPPPTNLWPVMWHGWPAPFLDGLMIVSACWERTFIIMVNIYQHLGHLGTDSNGT